MISAHSSEPRSPESIAWAYLARVAEPPCAAVIALVDDIGPVEAASAIRRRTVPGGHEAVLAATAARSESDCAVDDLDAAERIGARLVTRADPEWPAWSLLALGQADTAARGGEPLALWVRGPARLDDLAAASVALIGSRAASSYGEHVTQTLASGLSAQGFAVLSGGAFGIDGAAHRGGRGDRGGDGVWDRPRLPGVTLVAADRDRAHGRGDQRVPARDDSGETSVPHPESIGRRDERRDRGGRGRATVRRG